MTLDPLLRAGSPPGEVPVAPFRRLSTLWVQLTGTWCNLACAHCLNASGPRDPWLRPMGAPAVERAIEEARALGVREIYFSGGEPFLHGRILPLLRLALRVAPTTVLTNGTAIDDAMAERLLALAEESPYSLEIRVSVDDPDPERNDRIRGPGAWAAALGAIRRLDARGLLPIVTATEIFRQETVGEGGLYERLRDLLLSIGVSRPRVKILPVFRVGRSAAPGARRLSEEILEGFDRSLLQCAESRVVAEDGVYACPILAGLPGARLSAGRLADSFGPAPLYHAACVTCWETGVSCRNS